MLISVVSPRQQKHQIETFVEVIYFSDVYPEKMFSAMSETLPGFAKIPAIKTQRCQYK